MFSSAVTGVPLRDVNRSATLSMRSLGVTERKDRMSCGGPRQQPVTGQLEQLIGDEAQKPDHHDAQEDLFGEQAAHGVENEVSEPLVGGYKFSHHEVSPGPTERHAERVHHTRQG